MDKPEKNDNNCDLDLNQIWRNSSRLSTPALTLTVNHNDRLYYPKVTEYAIYEVQRPLLVKCFFYPDHESQSGFK
ncbi:unnamed protein product [Penicillium camemberti]|uniref:Str. FM013 n=1 Tax=Penicillium camemberti (strain FM 013) TaxID=1429867 RepID=A0A0G4PM21_PENC3|nr:unnamed protein product [Penicillium camemberti]